MALKREDLLKTLVRKELDFYVAGHSLRDRMANLLDTVEAWTTDWIEEAYGEGKSVLRNRIYGDSLSDSSRDDLIAHLMEIDTDNVVKGASLKARVSDLQSLAFGWVHDQRVPKAA